MTLPKVLEREFAQELNQYEEEKNMRYITSIERAGEERGKLKGQIEGEQKVILRQLNRRIGELQPSVIEQIHKLPVEQLEELAEALLDFSTVVNLQQWLNSRPKPVEQE